MTKLKDTCTKCEKHTLYWILITPIFVVMILVFIYLWGFNPLLSMIYLVIWLIANILEAYCCEDLKCPHAGKGCHPIGGFILAPYFYKMFFYNKIKKLKNDLNWFLELGSTAIAVSLIVFPIFWLVKLHLFYAIAYPILCVAYVFTHVFLICSVCVVTKTCMMGMLERKLRNGIFNKSV
ncbi:hypothetical protein HQ585_04845 [candidate division KSB1 bacterium]|nr:hypothetical protein [candidate division KSB1 bacterium]